MLPRRLKGTPEAAPSGGLPLQRLVEEVANTNPQARIALLWCGRTESHGTARGSLGLHPKSGSRPAYRTDYSPKKLHRRIEPLALSARSCRCTPFPSCVRRGMAAPYLLENEVHVALQLDCDCPVLRGLRDVFWFV